MQLPNKNLPWPISWDGVVEIAASEGCRLAAYPDPVSKGEPFTIGYGMTRRADGSKVTRGMVITQDEADAEFCVLLTDFTNDVKEVVNVPANENQLASMVSLAWNIGIAGFRGSSVLKAHNRGDFDAASRAFGLWNKAGGKVIKGLTLRRAREAALYLTPIYVEDNPPVPQQVDPESSLTRSPIAQSGAAATIGGVATAVTTAVSSVSDQVKDMGLDPLVIIGIIIAIAGAIIIFQRVKQRREGWS